MLSMLMHPHPPPDETLALLPHLRPHHSLRFRTPASSSPWLKILMLLRGPQVMPPTLPSPPLMPPCTCPTCLQRCLPSLRLQCPPNMPPMQLTILTLAVPSQHASDTAYHPYTRMPSQHASDAAYHPYAHSDLPTCLQHCLPSLSLQCPPDMPPMPPSNWPDPYAPAAPQDETTMLPPISALTNPYVCAPPPFLLCRLQFVRSRGALNPPYA
ncbi:hypothetical protein O181_064917 [Austropuccinia psidii MF-1]|uniref:Uncharacterized protein n=1 Tax=Austropuccinia psidii MF-1 TaxID=1389203 RepID=A0A9Q3ESJ3_9BASI|nr:hypothetical protein [Austropuccinia psidii MF-1]